jgi:hypothetical protein
MVHTSDHTLERIEQSDRHEIWQVARGTMHLSWSERSLLARFHGHGDARFADPLMRAGNALIAKSGQLELFFDADDISGYDSELRTAWTSWFIRQRSKMTRIHFVSRSKVASMGAAVVNLALLGLIEIHPDLRAFDAAARARGLGSTKRTR